MGVRLPLERKGPGSRNATSGPANVVTRGPSRKISAPKWLLGSLTLLLLGASVAYFVAELGTTSPTLWELKYGNFMCAEEGRFVLSTGAGLALGSDRGLVEATGLIADDVVLVSEGIIAGTGNETVLWRPGAGSRTVGPLEDGETLFGSDSGTYFTRRCLGGFSFGEKWGIRQVALDGQIIWETETYAVPVEARVCGGGVVVATVDIVGQGGPKVSWYGQARGTPTWEASLPGEFLRRIFPRSGGGIAVVTDSAVVALGPTGQTDWIYEAPGKIADAVMLDCSVAFCHLGSGPAVLKRFGTVQVVSLSEGGDVLWSSAFPGKGMSLGVWQIRADGPKTLVALSSTHVIALSQASGAEEWRNRVAGIPVNVQGHVALVSKGDSLLLADIQGPSN